jgi:hypothetical protein
MALARGFSRQHGITLLRHTRLRITPHPRHQRQPPGFTWAAGHGLTPGQPTPGGTTLLRHPIACLLPDRVPRSPHPPPRRAVRQGSDGQHHRPRHGRTITGTGISTRPPSTTPDGLALGPGSPWAEQPGPGTLGHPAAEILTLHSLLMPAFSLPHHPRLPHRAASHDAGRSPTQPGPYVRIATASAVRLSPATLSAQDHLTSELLRTLSRMAASKPTSWLSSRPHILSHLAHA